MIKLNNDWLILVDESQYTLVKDTHKTTKSKGKERPVYNYYGYYSSLTSVLKRYIDICIRQKLKDNVYELYEVIGIIEKENENIKNCLKSWIR